MQLSSWKSPFLKATFSGFIDNNELSIAVAKTINYLFAGGKVIEIKYEIYSKFLYIFFTILTKQKSLDPLNRGHL